jgi:hypothetical protein
VKTSGMGLWQGDFPRLYFFGLNGISQAVNLADNGVRDRPAEWQKAYEPDYMAHIIAKLGLEGWEMVGTGTHTDVRSHCIYFRRPIE